MEDEEVEDKEQEKKEEDSKDKASYRKFLGGIDSISPTKKTVTKRKITTGSKTKRKVKKIKTEEIVRPEDEDVLDLKADKKSKKKKKRVKD